MHFHPDKCNLISITQKRKPIHFTYKLHYHLLAKVEHSKYLGITLQSNLKWNKHINSITNKANQFKRSPNVYCSTVSTLALNNEHSLYIITITVVQNHCTHQLGASTKSSIVKECRNMKKKKNTNPNTDRKVMV